jgi:hypothetical protein
MKNAGLNQDEVKLTKPVVGLSAFALMLLGASGVGSEAFASNVTVTAQVSVATPISKTELMVGSKPIKPRPNNTNRHNNDGHNFNNHDHKVQRDVRGVAFAGSIARRFDV